MNHVHAKMGVVSGVFAFGIVACREEPPKEEEFQCERLELEFTTLSSPQEGAFVRRPEVQGILWICSQGDCDQEEAWQKEALRRRPLETARMDRIGFFSGDNLVIPKGATVHIILEDPVWLGGTKNPITKNRVQNTYLGRASSVVEAFPLHLSDTNFSATLSCVH